MNPPEPSEPGITSLQPYSASDQALLVCPVVLEGGALNHREQGLQMLWPLLRGNRCFLSQSQNPGHCKFWSSVPEKWGFVTTGLLKPKNILHTVLHSDDLMLSKTSLWDLWFWLSIWAQGTVLPSYLTGRGFVMRHLLCFWRKYFCDKCYIKTHKDMNNPVFSEEFKWHAINKAKATHWLKKVKKKTNQKYWIALFILPTKWGEAMGKNSF